MPAPARTCLAQRGFHSARAKKAPEVGALPPQGRAVEAELTLLFAEARGMQRAAAVGRLAESDGRVQHLVIDDVVHEELGDEGTVQRRIDPDHALVLVVAAE